MAGVRVACGPAPSTYAISVFLRSSLLPEHAVFAFHYAENGMGSLFVLYEYTTRKD